MTQLEFEREVDAFRRMLEFKSFPSVGAECWFDVEGDNHRAVVTIHHDYGVIRYRQLTVVPSQHREGELAIDCGDAAPLKATSAGVYCYLWHAAEAELARVQGTAV